MSDFPVTEVLPSVYRLDDPRGVSMYLLVGDKGALLVDTGLGIGDVRGTVEAITTLPLTVVNTHCHIDHSGGDYQFPRVYIPEPEFPVAQNWYESDEVKNVGLDLPGADLPASFDRERYFAWRGENLVPLAAGTVFDLGGLTAKAVPLPGHTRGSMGFLVPELELLLTGDAIAPVIYLVFPESLTVGEYMKTLEAARALPFRRFLAGHSPEPIDKERLGLYLDCARALDPARTMGFRNPLFPHIRARMFVYEDPERPREYASLCYVAEKLGS